VGLDPRYVRRFRWFHKAQAVRHSGASLRRDWRFVLVDLEPDNFTYQITNESRLRGATAGRSLWTKPSPSFGKRLGWHALARAIRPELTIETGAHDGSSRWDLQCVAELLAADGVLLSNDAQGHARSVGSLRGPRPGLLRVQESPAHHFYPGARRGASGSVF
jgi:hypothetical protein